MVVHFDQPAQEATLADYLHEVEHAQDRITRLEQGDMTSSIETIPEKMRAVVDALQSLRGIAKISAVTIVAELGEVSRFKASHDSLWDTAVQFPVSIPPENIRVAVESQRPAIPTCDVLWLRLPGHIVTVHVSGPRLAVRQKTASQEVKGYCLEGTTSITSAIY